MQQEMCFCCLFGPKLLGLCIWVRTFHHKLKHIIADVKILGKLLTGEYVGGEPGIGGCKDFREGKSRLVVSAAVSLLEQAGRRAGRLLVCTEHYLSALELRVLGLCFLSAPFWWLKQQAT